MQKEFVTTNSKETQELGKLLALEFQTGGIVCLDGELGAGKTTFTQGFLEGLGLRGPFTSPTFLIMKEYKLKAKSHSPRLTETTTRRRESGNPKAAYHIDAYRIGTEDMLSLGWEEIIANKNNIVIIEWAERVSDIVPKNALWINFEWIGEEERRMIMSNSQFSITKCQSMIN